MKNKILRAASACLLLLLEPAAAQYRNALPGYRFEFPRDYFDHPDFQTEWWYYTGNVTSPSGRHFGFELTFFRQAVARDATPASAWDVRDLYLAHFAVSDLDGQHFYHRERTNRAGPGVASASESQGRIWNGNWQVYWNGSEQQLQAVDTQAQLRLTLHPEKEPTIHGENGVSQKSAGSGHASYYISLTRLDAAGEIQLGDEKFTVAGLAWMDHEFFTQQLGADQVGWDWLSLQLSDHTELMLYDLRRKDGSVDSFSAGTYIDAEGKSTHLRLNDFVLQPLGETWKSSSTHATYPISWRIGVPKLNMTLEAHTKLASQELGTTSGVVPAYWEGAISLEGQRGAQQISGVGYLEMTGYDRPVTLAP